MQFLFWFGNFWTCSAMQEPDVADELLPASSEFFPAGENWMPFGSNASSTPQVQQQEQHPSTAALAAESLLTQLGHLPAQLNSSSSLVVVPQTEVGSPVISGIPPHVQLTRKNRSYSTSEQYYHMQGACANQGSSSQLQSTSHFSLQFLEPPNSLAATGQYTHPALMATPVIPAGLAEHAAGDRSTLHSGASMPNSSSLLKPGVPLLKLEALMAGGSSAGSAAQQQQSPGQAASPAGRQLATGHAQSSARQPSLSAPGALSTCRTPNSSSPGKPLSSGRAQQAATAAAAAVPAADAAEQAAAAEPEQEQSSTLQQQQQELLQAQQQQQELLQAQRQQQELLQAQRQQQQQQLELQSELEGSQQRLLEVMAQLAAEQQARAALQQQLDHLGVKARSQESQLEFAHQQLDMRQQELHAQVAALEVAHHTTQQLQDSLHSLSEELNRTKQEAEEVSRQQQSDASEARRWAEEAAALQGKLRQLTAEQQVANRELDDTKEQLQQLQHLHSSNGRRMVELEGDAAQCSQQLAAVNERAMLLEAQNKRLNEELSAAEVAHNRLTQQLAAADLQNSKLSQQLASNEAQHSRFEQQLAAADTQNAKLLQQLSAAEGEAAALRTEVTLLQTSRQQSDTTCEQLQHLQQEAQRQVAQLRAEVAQASQDMMSLRAQNENLVMRLSAADSSNAALQSGLDQSWQAARAADRVAQDAKQQLMQAQQQMLQLQQQGAAGALSAASGLGISALALSHKHAGLAASWDRPIGSYGLGYGGPLSAGMAMDSSRVRFDGAGLQAGSLCASQDWQGGMRSLAASVDAAPWGAQQHQHQQQPGACSSISNSPSPTERQAVSRPAQQQEQPAAAATAATSRSTDTCPWFAGGGGRVGSTQQISSHAGPAPLSQPPSSTQLEQRPELRQQQQPAVSAGPTHVHVQASAADLGYSGHQLALSNDMMSVVEVMAAAKQLEDQLLCLCQERDELDKELAKMPAGAGRTIKGRQRKLAVEARLEELGLQISKARTQIKQLSGNIKL